jgi:hypothetical protein
MRFLRALIKPRTQIGADRLAGEAIKRDTIQAGGKREFRVVSHKLPFCPHGELFPNAVDGRDNLSGDSFSVDEHDAVDQVF